MAFIGGEIVTTATARSLTSALGLSAPRRVQQLQLQYNTGATGTTYVGKSDVTATADRLGICTVARDFELQATYGNPVSTDDVYLISTAADEALFCSIVE